MQFPIRTVGSWKKWTIHPSIQGNPSQLPWIGKQDTSWIDQLSFKGLIHRDNHLYSHTVNLELEANLTSMSLDYERNPESHLTTPEGRGPNQREPWNLPGLSSCKATVRSTMPPLFREFKSNLFFLPVLSREMHHYFSWVCLIQAAASLLRVNVVVCSLFTLRILCFYTSKLLAFNTWTCLIGFICMGTKNLMFLIILL